MTDPNEATADLPPDPGSLVMSLRAFGYDLPSALADLIDNSITASARSIWVDFHWHGADSVIAVTDDGIGMSEDELLAAMRLGSQSPLVWRPRHDLGRFGLGLKTASFSHCLRLTVRSRKADRAPATLCWDLDHLRRVNSWQILTHGNHEAEPHFARLDNLPHGTVVVWQRLDRLVAGHDTLDDRHQSLFLDRAMAVRDHLAMVFHQLMTGPGGVRISLNAGAPIEPWDPFLPAEPATQRFPTTRLRFHGEVVEVEPFVLPHNSRLGREKYVAAGGGRGWNAHQGFYVYRNHRLLVAGDWLGLGWAKEEHYKLARIRVELPNALDHDWSLDVTKSRAIPPPALRGELRRIGEVTRQRAKEVFSHRGSKLTPQHEQAPILLWEPMSKHNKVRYSLNRDHPLLKRALAGATDRASFLALLRLVEETVPFPHITIQNSERPHSLPTPFEGAPASQIRDVMAHVFAALVASGLAPSEALARLAMIHPFNSFPEVLQVFREEQIDG